MAVGKPRSLNDIDLTYPLSDTVTVCVNFEKEMALCSQHLGFRQHHSEDAGTLTHLRFSVRARVRVYKLITRFSMFK